MLFLRLFSGCLLQLFPFAMISLYPFAGHYRTSDKKARLFTVTLLTGLSLIFTTITLFLKLIISTHYLFQLTNLVFVCCLIPCFVFYIIIVKDIWQKKLFVFMFTLIAAITMTSLNNTICTRILLNVTTDYLPYDRVSLPILFFITCLTVPVLILIIKKEFIPMSDFLSKQEYNYLCCLSAILFLVLASGLIPIDYSYLYNPMTIYLYLSLQISVFLIYIVIFRMFRIAHKRALAEQNMAQYETQIEVQSEQYRQLMEQVTEIRRMRHDFRHELLLMRQSVAENNQEMLLKIMDTQINSLDTLTIEQFSNNEVINILVSHYHSLAERNNIKMPIQISCKKDLSITISELSVLLGNLLENALTATLGATKDFRYIKLHILQKANMLIITLDNGFNGIASIQDGTYCSTKEGHTGIGLNSIKKIAQKYNGAAEFTHEEYVFHASVMVQV